MQFLPHRKPCFHYKDQQRTNVRKRIIDIVIVTKIVCVDNALNSECV